MAVSKRNVAVLGGILITVASCLGMVGMYENFGWPGVGGLAVVIAIMVGSGYLADFRKKSTPE